MTKISKRTKNLLTTLADFLVNVPRKRYNQQEYASEAFCKLKSDERFHACGTTACAIGWATTIPKFRRQGLKLIHDDDYFADYTFPTIAYKDTTGFEAIIKFFNHDLSYLEVDELFGSTEKRTPKQEAKVIRDFVRNSS